MSEQKKVDYVNVFWGSKTFSRQSEGKLTNKWYFFKPQSANLSPACYLPNSTFCVVPYSGGYSSGYGTDNPCFGSVPTSFAKENFIKGFTHFSHSGVGFINNFYNYFMICPSQDDQRILNEKGGCGWYEVETPTFSAKIALDGSAANYEFELKEDKSITILPYYGGLDNIRLKPFSYEYTEERRGDKLIFCVNINSMELFFAVESKEKFVINKDNGRYKLNFESNRIALSVSYSFVSADDACEKLTKATYSYAGAKTLAEQLWTKALSIVDIKGDNRIKELFYTALYNALKKPCIDNFVYPVFDLATMWDLYKTHFPMMYILYPETATTIINSLAGYFVNEKFFKNSQLMELKPPYRKSRQAISLMSISIATAYLYGIEANYDILLPLAKKDVEYYSTKAKMLKPYPTHNLDFLDAYYALNACGIEWTEATQATAKYREERLYNKKGLLKDGFRRNYYEGTSKNYSFRVSASMAERLKKSDKIKLVNEMDTFFGFVGDDVVNFTTPTSPRIVNKHGKRYRRFEGLNNETDMETMYFYHKLNEFDKCEDVINEVIAHNFNTTNGGIPGNDDSGGLTSWLVLNILGLYPVIGTNEILIGSPQMDEATIMLDKNKLTIKVVGRTAHKHIRKVTLNGEELAEREIDFITLKRGGELVIEY